MCRATIDAKPSTPNVEQWRQWLADKAERQDIGHRCSRRLREIYERDVLDARERLRNVELRERNIQAFDRRLRELGVADRDGRWAAESVASKVGALEDETTMEAQRIVARLAEILNQRTPA